MVQVKRMLVVILIAGAIAVMAAPSMKARLVYAAPHGPWDGLENDLGSAAGSFESVTSEQLLHGDPWHGPLNNLHSDRP
jgi:hypothetical protein